jgi:hypothetical protein
MPQTMRINRGHHDGVEEAKRFGDTQEVGEQRTGTIGDLLEVRREFRYRNAVWKHRDLGIAFDKLLACFL